MNSNRMTLTLPPNKGLLSFIEDAARRYAKLFEFPRALQDSIVLAVLEACEELLRQSGEAGINSDYSISFDLRNEAITIEICYDGKIPLNPHLTESYKVPDGSEDISSFDLARLDSLWLYLIKKHMDRVFFQVDGSLHSRRMLKYRRGEGEEMRLWVLSLSPKLKEKLHAEWIERDGQLRGGLLEDLESQKVLRLGPREASVVRRMNGQTTLYEIYLECVGEFGPFAPQMVVTLFEALEEVGMLADPDPGRKVGKVRAVLNKILNPVFSVPKADAVVETIYRLVRPLVSPAGAAVCLLIGFSGLIPLIAVHPFDDPSFRELEEMILARPSVLITVYLLSMLMVALHELGHGLVCKHYGGRVPRLGIMFYLASFIFFCDTTSSWNFTRKAQRIMVSLAGPLTTFAFLGVSLWADAYYDNTGAFWEPVWLMFSTICFFGLVMNINPFIRMDGYYVLMDWTGIPNLRERSFKYLESRIVGLFVKQSAREKWEPEPNERLILVLYGLIGGVMTLVFFLLPIVWYGWSLWEGSAHKGRIIMGIVVVVIALLRLSYSAHQKFKSMRYREYKLV